MFEAVLPGDLVWCRFPEGLVKPPKPGPKPRPALVVKIGEMDGAFAVEVAYGTSQNVARLLAGEFAITPADGTSYLHAGLSHPTKFNLARRVELPFDATWFGIAPGALFGQHPKLGVLHPALMRRALAAFRAVA